MAVRADRVKISEIMYHPGLGKPGEAGYVAEDTRQEFIELYNADTQEVNLKGWRFDKGVAYVFPDVTLAAQGYLVVAADADTARFKETYRQKYPTVANALVVGGWTGLLGNNGDSLELVDSAGKTVDAVAYASEGDWALRREGDGYPGQPGWWRGWRWTSGANAGGKSLELVDLALSNKYGQNWAASVSDGGTPGGPNSVVATPKAPLVLEVRHTPAVPRSTQSVTVTTRLVDAAGTSPGASVWYRVDGAAVFTEAPMFDDGRHGDGAANDGVFGAVLAALPDQTVVEYYVKAKGDGGRTRTWPGPTDDQGTQGANALYQVDDAVYTGGQPVYRLIIPKADWDAWLNLMDRVSDGAYSDPMMNATLVTVDGAGTEARYGTGVRNRGAGTRTAHPHNLHIAIPNDRAWRNQTAISVNSRTVHSQVAGNAVNVVAGLPCEYGGPVQLRVNGANLAHATPSGGTDSYQFGSYYAFQPYSDEWLKDHFATDPDGNIYKGIWNMDNHSLKHAANLAYLGEDPAVYRLAYAPTGPTSDAGPYDKKNNVSQDDWSDLINLCRVLNEAPDATFVEQAGRVINIDEWLNYLAVTSLMGNGETTFGTGTGDDYSMYRGGVDRRFLLLPHDMDTVLGQGDNVPDYARTVFKACDISVVNRLLKDPAIAPRYYAILKRQADTTFAAATVNPLLDEVLGGWVPDSYIKSMKEFVAIRRTNVLAQIATGVAVRSDLPVVSGYPRTSSASAALTGSADAIRTRTVLVAGRPANWVPWQATWSVSEVPLNPGLNRVVVRALDENANEVDRAIMTIWRDTGTTTPVAGGALTADTRWTAAGGPYTIKAGLTVNAGATLTIEPGASVYLGDGVDLKVANGGRIVAEGTSTQAISFVSAPGAGASWGGITINGAAGSVETRLAHVYFEGNGTTCIEVAGGTLSLDHADFGTTTHQYVALDDSSFLISNCHFPTSTAAFELLHGTGGIKVGGRGVVRDCFFGSTTGYNDIVDFTGGNRPNQPIIQFYNNVFSGASDDILDLDGTDAWIEGNIFLHVHRNGAPDSSSAISGGSSGNDTSEITAIGNIFYDCDNAATAKQGNFYTFLNNTIVHMTKTGGQDFDSSAINMRDTTPDLTSFGKGCYLRDNIIVDVEKGNLVRNYDAAQTLVTFDHNILPVAWNGPGTDNVVVDPAFQYVPPLAETFFTNWAQAQVLRDWFSLRSGSPAQGTGSSGGDQGGVISRGAKLSGVPLGTTTNTSATLTVGPWVTGFGLPTAGFPEGSGFPRYQWQLDGGAWSAETPASIPITLSNLANGPHAVAVRSKNDALYYQDDPALGFSATVTTSRTWTVNTSLAGHIRLNEILAHNVSITTASDAHADAVELYNEGGQAVDLAGWTMTKDPTNGVRLVFPSGTVMAPGQYRVVFADSLTNASGLHLGFGIDREGDAVYLLDRGGTVIDTVVFGLQAPDLSIGRLADGQWGLTKPTLGSANQPQPLADANQLVINEWLAHARNAAPSDFIELFNPGSEPAALGGLILANQSVGQPGLPALPALSFIPAKGFALFYADNQAAKGSTHLAFGLSPAPGALGLFTPELTPIDVVFYGFQTTDVSQGRSPNGAPSLAFFPIPTPGYVNPGEANPIEIVTTSFPLIANTNVWKYEQTSIPGTDWVTPGYAGDAGWPAGAALLYVESGSKPWPKNTPLTLGRMTYYFRTHFTVPTNTAGMTLDLNTIIDDGAVFYLNGQEVFRVHMPAGGVDYTTAANDHESALEGPFTLPATHLHVGDNVMAVEVHQVNADSSDIVFGLSLDASLSVTNVVTNSTRVSVVLNEIMAHNVSLTNDDGVVGDWIELYSPSGGAIDLADLSLTDDPTTPRKWVFPANSIIPAGGYRVIPSFAGTNAVGGNTGFGLKAEGGAVFLFDGMAHDGKLLDSVTYGVQAADRAIGRIDSQGAWALTVPTPGAPNQAASLGNPGGLRLNEWMANPASGGDWFELYNPDPLPVALAGLVLTDDPTKTDQPALAPLSFMGTGLAGYQKFIADGTPDQGANHVAFKLASAGERIELHAADGALIDRVIFGPQSAGLSEGRFPDGSANVVVFTNAATPGAPNAMGTPLPQDTDGDGMPDAWETAHGLDPRNASDALLDTDGDGLTNLQEYWAGTDPRDPRSAIKATLEWRPGQPAAIRFTSVAGKSYTVQYADSLLAGAWRNLASVVASGPETVEALNDGGSTSDQSRFYRVVLNPPAP